MKENIILCGLPKSGKTSVGMGLSKVLLRLFIDTDHLIEKVYFEKYKKKYTCRDIFLKEGEVFFRSLEKKTILSLDIKNCIISLGGGSFTDIEIIDHLKTLGKVIYLKSCNEKLFERMISHGMPAYLQNQPHPFDFFCQLAETRVLQFETYADKQVDTIDKNVHELVELMSNLVASM